jgi:hypothetical protein
MKIIKILILKDFRARAASVTITLKIKCTLNNNEIINIKKKAYERLYFIYFYYKVYKAKYFIYFINKIYEIKYFKCFIYKVQEI